MKEIPRLIVKYTSKALPGARSVLGADFFFAMNEFGKNETKAKCVKLVQSWRAFEQPTPISWYMPR